MNQLVASFSRDRLMKFIACCNKLVHDINEVPRLQIINVTGDTQITESIESREMLFKS